METTDPPSHWHSYTPPRALAVATQLSPPPEAREPPRPTAAQLARERRILARRQREVEQELATAQTRLKSLEFERDAYARRIAEIDHQLNATP